PLLSSSSALSDLWARVGGPWHEVGDEWNQLFSGIKGYRQGYVNTPFGQRLALGGPIDLGDEIVMWVETEGGQYWRGAVYDRYDGTGWENTDTVEASIAADKALPLEGEYELRRLIIQTVVPNWSGLRQIFGVGQPVSIDIPLDIRYSFTDAGGSDTRDPFSAPASVSLIRSRIPLNRDRPYTLVSSASVADVESLTEAGEDYPAWITRRYLQLPSDLPQRIGELAREITAPHHNTYDKAVALQDYLRRTIEYREDIEPPPADRDPIDYLLFDSREGYCNYYASAMVVMARGVGIPSRLAVGYVGGEFDDETGQYAVRERDTHAWVEVYFPRYGWVEFEPTASEAPIVRPTEPEGALRDETGEFRAHRPDLDTPFQRDLSLEEMAEPVRASASGERWGAIGRAIGLVVIAGLAGAAGLWMIRRRWLGGFSEVERAYRAMTTYGRLLGVTAQACQTPHEYATLLTEEVPEQRWEIRRIVTLYVQDRFSPHGIAVGQEEAAGEAWRTLRRALWGKLPGRSVDIGRRVLRRPS
ncbi:MAG: transglutaminaseTgpA domain-containing protein, partial [Anaerolineae bacterium]